MQHNKIICSLNLLLIFIFPLLYSFRSRSNLKFVSKSVCHYYMTINESGRSNRDMIKKMAEPLLNSVLIQQTIEDWTKPLPPTALTSPLVIVGPSGVGKGRLIKALLKDYTRFFRKVVTYTCRFERRDERNGTHYYFISREEFEQKILQKEYLEWSTVHNNLYGISHAEWLNATNSSRIPLLEIDIQGARKIKALSESLGITPKFLFIAPTNISALQDRLRIRNTEKDVQIELRLENAVNEVAESKEPGLFDHVLVNENFTDTANEMFRLVRDWYPSLPSAAKIQMLLRRARAVRKLGTTGVASGISSEAASD